MSSKYKILFIFFAIMLIYLPSLSAELCLLDDLDMFKNLSTRDDFDLIKLFFPQSNSGLYYRPIIFVSFLIDRFVWDLNPSIMHFENIIIHIISTISVFLIAHLITSKNSFLPMAAAFIFGLHPIATESVNWISGRTDLLAVMFILISLYTILYYKNTHQKYLLLISLLAFFLAVFAKETSIGFVPAAIFIIVAKNQTDSSNYNRKKFISSCIVFIFVASCMVLSSLILFNYFIPIAISFVYLIYLVSMKNFQINSILLKKTLIMVFSCFSICWFSFWGIRKLAFSSQSPQIQRTVQLLFGDTNYTLGVFFKAVGFYAKKFIFPLPLNFAIREVNPLYSLVGIFLLCFVAVLISKRKLYSALVISGFCMVAPVLPLAFESIAWTSFADRYVYPATPFWILSITSYAYSSGIERLSLKTKKYYIAAFLIIASMSTFFTVERNFIWQTNIALFKDTIEKTSDYKPLRGLYMTALFEKGLYDEALEQYRIAKLIQSIQLKYNPNYELFYVQILIAKKQYKEAEIELEEIKKQTKGKHPEVFERFIELETHLILNSNDDNNKNQLLRKMTTIYDQWFELTKNPMLLYRKGQLLLANNAKNEAAITFLAASKLFPEHNEYRLYSEILSKKLLGKEKG